MIKFKRFLRHACAPLSTILAIVASSFQVYLLGLVENWVHSSICVFITSNILIFNNVIAYFPHMMQPCPHSNSSTLLLTHMKETRTVWGLPSVLTLSEKTLHLLTRLIVVDADIEAQALEAFEQLTCVSVRAIAYIHPCQDNLLRTHTLL